MKTIGYIYRYSEEEKKGILVYGHSKAPNWTLPILFDTNDCETKVETGDLVYFCITENNKANNIEKASLLNFKKDVIDNTIFNKGSHILFEDISKITIPEKLKREDVENTMFKDLFVKDGIFNANDSSLHEFNIALRKSKPITLPKDICSLFSLFGDMNHYEEVSLWADIDSEYDDYDNDTIKINILDLKYWFKKDMIKRANYNIKTAKQVTNLFNYFDRENKKLSFKAPSCGYQGEDKCISSEWRYILSVLSSQELYYLCQQITMLQPAMPRKFCFDNIDALSIEYGFPTVSICEAYYRNRITKSSSTYDYILIKNKLSFAINRHNYKYKKEEGVHLNKIKKSTLNEMNHLLENQYRNVILENLKMSLSKLYSNEDFIEKRISSLISDNNFAYLQKLGCFIEDHYIINENSDFKIVEQYIADFNNLLKEDQIFLKKHVREKVKDYILYAAKEGRALKLMVYADELGYPMRISMEEILKEAKEIKDNKFAETEYLDDLETAFANNLITESQYILQFKKLTKDFSISELIDTLFHERFNKKSIQVQVYLLAKLFNDYNVKSLYEYNYIKHHYFKICTLNDLINFCEDCAIDKRINKEIWAKKRLEIIDGLSEEDRMKLLRENDDEDRIPF